MKRNQHTIEDRLVSSRVSPEPDPGDNPDLSIISHLSPQRVNSPDVEVRIIVLCISGV